MKKLYSDDLERDYVNSSNASYRRKFGQVFTSFQIALFMSEWILSNDKDELTILDPAAGLGVFQRAISCQNKYYNKPISFDLYETDANLSDRLIRILYELGVKKNLYQEDFLANSLNKTYDGIIANPPYHHHCHINDKYQVFHHISKTASFNFSVETNIYCWFLIKSLELLDKQGRAAFILPSEFLNSNYGERIKDYLIQTGVLRHLIAVDYSINLFDEALTTSLILLVEKNSDSSGSDTDSRVSFQTIDHIDEFTCLSQFLSRGDGYSYPMNELDPKIKWKNYFYDIISSHAFMSNPKKNLIPLSKLGRFKRGIATGANRFFTLTRLEALENQLPDDSLLPCITKANHVQDIHFSKDHFRQIIRDNKKVYLFDGGRSNSDSCQKYIKRGEHKGIHDRFLTKRRTPWYSIEKRSVAKIWVGVFSRGGIRFIWNDTNCITLTCFHNFYPTSFGEKYLDILFLYFNTNFQNKLFEREHREYGNGLIKFEPNDLNKSYVLNFDVLSHRQYNNMADMQNKFITAAPRERTILINKADKLLEKGGL